MKVKLRTFDMRFKDPGWTGDIRTDLPTENPRAEDGIKTVVIHGKRVSWDSPKARWPHAELWGMTRCNTLFWGESLTDWDRWFDVHPVDPTDYHQGIKAKRPEAWDWYARQDTARPIYLLEPHPEVPASVAFPRQRVQDFHRTTRFTVSVDWLVGLALCEGFQRIVFNGVGTRFHPDFQFAHQGTLYWVGYLDGKGIELLFEGPSCYAPPEKVYGYEVGAPKYADTDVKELVDV